MQAVASTSVAGASGAGTLLLEFGMVTAICSKRWRPLLACAAIGFHLGIYYAMNITFNSWPLLLTFFDWDRRVAGEARDPP